jgi:3D (Asp-Asp-Asp) domain-containing protein
VLASVLAFGCSAEPEPMYMTVQASAYNSLPEQTNDQPNIAAWGDELRPGMKAIAVSRDLLREGLTRGTEVRIEGLKGCYRVLDKMHPRWTRKIDIYMGEDLDAALEWGVREVRISWVPEHGDS